MPRKDKTPKFPDSYLGERAKEYDNEKWMERNQKKTTERVIEYLYDSKLGKEEVSLPSETLILDLGCGSGFSSEFLINYDFHVIGIDILTDMISLARKRKKEALPRSKDLELILADITKLPIRSRSIDHIISISAYNFITHDSKSEREIFSIVNTTAQYINEILKRNGRFIIEFYPESEKMLEIFKKSFIKAGFDGFSIKEKEEQKSGKTFLLLKKSTHKKIDLID
ncbi:MAG: class I SAM-dependent methyltransferase [Promethearchaeia archaeon]